MSPKYSDRSIFEKSSIWNSVDVNPRQSASAGPSSVGTPHGFGLKDLSWGRPCSCMMRASFELKQQNASALLNASDQRPFVCAVRAKTVAPARRVHYGRLEVFLAAAP